MHFLHYSLIHLGLYAFIIYLLPDILIYQQHTTEFRLFSVAVKLIITNCGFRIGFMAIRCNFALSPRQNCKLYMGLLSILSAWIDSVRIDRKKLK